MERSNSSLKSQDPPILKRYLGTVPEDDKREDKNDKELIWNITQSNSSEWDDRTSSSYHEHARNNSGAFGLIANLFNCRSAASKYKFYEEQESIYWIGDREEERISKSKNYPPFRFHPKLFNTNKLQSHFRKAHETPKSWLSKCYDCNETKNKKQWKDDVMNKGQTYSIYDYGREEMDRLEGVEKHSIFECKTRSLMDDDASDDDEDERRQHKHSLSWKAKWNNVLQCESEFRDKHESFPLGSSFMTYSSNSSSGNSTNSPKPASPDTEKELFWTDLIDTVQQSLRLDEGENSSSSTVKRSNSRRSSWEEIENPFHNDWARIEVSISVSFVFCNF